MIRKAIQSCPPGPCPLLRESYDEVTRRENKLLQFRCSIKHLPYEVSFIVKTIRLNHRIQHTCKQILARNQVPIDVFVHIQPFIYELDLEHVRLPPRGFSRAVHHLIRMEKVTDIPQALLIGKQFDQFDHGQNRVGVALLREFRDALWPSMCRVWNIGDARPELWYLQASFAIGYIN